MKRSVVITGLGPICSIASDAPSFQNAVSSAQRSITPIESFDPSAFRAQLAGQVTEPNIRDMVPKPYRKATKVMARDTELAVIAAKAAADDAGLKTRGSEDDDSGFTIDPARSGCNIGAGLIACDTAELSRAVATAANDDGSFSDSKWGTIEPGSAGMNNLPPLWLLKYLPNMLACHVTIIHGLEGPSNTIMGAEAGALLSIGESMRIIERDDADLCFAGGAESRVNPHGLLRWELSDKLATATTTDDPADSCKPYDPASQGCFLGEAGGMLVIEEATHAQNRNARVYATLAGFAATQSLTPALPIFDDEPTDSDEGLERAITNALKDANLTPDDIDIVYPLAVGIPELDAREAGAIQSALGPRADQIPWITLSDKVGNTLAAHGAIAAAAAALALSSQTIPDSPTRSPSNPPNELRNALVCTPSLAGQCAALVLSR